MLVCGCVHRSLGDAQCSTVFVIGHDVTGCLEHNEDEHVKYVTF